MGLVGAQAVVVTDGPVVTPGLTPGVDAGWYREVTEFAATTPGWLADMAEVATDAGLAAFALLFVFAWWRSRRGDARGVALAVIAPLATVVAYLVSEVTKSFVREDRPCRAVAGVVTLVPCPATGDWSFPSNHATIAAAAAVALVLAWRRLAWLVVPLALLLGSTRVYLGVHYPHDVAAGLLLGGGVALLLGLVLAGPLVPVVRRLRVLPLVGVLMVAGGAAAGRTPEAAGPRAQVMRGPARRVSTTSVRSDRTDGGSRRGT
ncbi:phosphatase PAP2 family protein [Actinopolymorpha rutila]|uniref:Undecaprenyl-diphosphatase n=1 Tax=Actinopolymorpha rutila TaxID=446787 RepID=A0A852ZGN9_9ACTN|nr:phosphatase PAP2 family protein [Actinopolymorpha rutila]NYH88180.1 undecaprenyl-diphosphatase [Actinopolymorpha rutila]